MKAIQFKSFGKPEVLEVVDLPTLKADAGSAVMQVKAASINPSDVKNVSGHFEHTVLPRTPGRDIGFTRDGTHAKFIKVPLAALSRKPGTLSHAEASAIGVNFVVAWLGTMKYAHLKAGETIAVIGARVIAVDRHPLSGGYACGLFDRPLRSLRRKYRRRPRPHR